MEVFWVSTMVVTLGEIGDKTQLLALLLAARYKKPLPIVLGILVATLANHTLAGLVGDWIRQWMGPEPLRWVLGAAFVAVGLWTLKPDEIEEEPKTFGHFGVFMVTFLTFFMAEMGDKTQLATVMLAAKFPDLMMVIAGTTTGMLLADVPAVFLGHVASDHIPFKAVRFAAAGVFILMGVATLAGFSLF